MKHLRIRFSLLVIAICLITIVLGFAGAIEIASFKKTYTESLVASYSVAGTEPVRTIEYAIKYGKLLKNFYGMKNLLSGTQQDFPEITDIKIILPEGDVIYSLKENKKGDKITEDIRKTAFSKTDFISGKNYIITEDEYHILIPIMDKQKVKSGALDMILDKSAINVKVTRYFNQIMIFFIVVALASMVVIVLLLYFIPVIKYNGEIKIKVLALILISVLGVAQLVFGLLNYNFYKKIYVEISEENTSMVVKVVQRDINVVIEKGVPVNELNGIENWLSSIAQSVPEIESLYISNEGFVKLVISKIYIEKKLYDIALDTLTVMLISFIFMTEIIITLLLFLRRRKSISERTSAEEELTELKMIRPIAFIFFFAFSMTTSFIPIVMRGFSNSLMWMPEGVKLSLPSSLEVFGTIISTIITGYIIHKRGWRPPFFYGIFIVCLGSILSGISFNGTMFILARLITGIGYGLSWMAMRGYVSTFNSSYQTQGFSSLNSGIMAGINCGVVLGAMIAERSGYPLVFFITVGLLILSLVIVLLLIKNNKKEIIQIQNVHSRLKKDIFNLVSNSKTIAFVLLVLVPASICGVFLTYLFPITATEMGVSSASIGRTFLMYGMFVVYLGPTFGKHVGSKISIKKSIIVANLFYGLAILVFGFGMNANAAILAVLILGFADSFGVAAQSSYFLSLDVSKKAGSGISLATYSVFYKLGQMIGPLIFGVMIGFGSSIGTKIIGTLTLVLIIAYIGINMKVKTANKSMEM